MHYPTSSRKTWYQDILLLTLGIALIFGLFLGTRYLSIPDEGRYAEIPREMLVTQDFVTPHINFIKYFEKPPLFYWIVAGSIKTFGVNEWAVRIPNALLALLCCLLVYCAGRKLFNRRTGILSSIILATSLLYFVFARFVTLDMSVSVFLTASLLFFILGAQYPPGKKRRLMLYGTYVFSAFAVLTKGLIGIVFIGMIIFAWIALLNEWRLLKTLYLPSGILIFLIIALPWHILVQLKNPEFFYFYFIEQQFLRYSTMIAGRYQPNWFFIPVLIFGFLPWIVFLPVALYKNAPKTWQQIKEKKNIVFLMLWAIIIFLFFSFSHSKLIPYILPVFPPLALLTGYYLSNHWEKQNKYLWVSLGYYSLPIYIAIGIILAFWIIPHFNIPIPLSVIPYLWAMGILIMLSTVLAALFCWKNRTAMAFATLAIGTSIVFILASMNIQAFDTKSTKPLITVLKPLLQPSDKIIAYHAYFQDMPFYLQQKIMTASVTDELVFGMQHENTQSWMFDDKTFWQYWNSPKRVFMFVTQDNFKNIPPEHKNLYVIASTTDTVLVTNHPLKQGSQK